MLNPVIEREFRTKMRNWRSPALLGLFLSVLCSVIFMIFKTRDISSPFDPTFFMPLIAVQSYSILATLLLLLMFLIIPAITSSAISGERERQTLDLMLSSDFSPYKIIWGKIVVLVSQTFLLLVAACPFLSIVLLYGGIGISDIAKLFGFYIMTSLLIASFGIYFSCIFKRSMTATIATYLVIFVITIGTMIACQYWISYNVQLSNAQMSDMQMYVLPYIPTPTDYNIFMFANPFYGFSTIIPEGIIQGAFESIFRMHSYNNRIFDAYNMSVFLQPFALNLIFDGVFSILLFILAVERLKPIKNHIGNYLGLNRKLPK